MIYTHIAAAIVAALCAWAFQANRYAAEIAEIRLDQAIALGDAIATARAAETTFNRRIEEARNAATVREIALRRDATAARAESDGLRGQLADAARRIAEAPEPAVRDYAATVSKLFGECSRRYTEVADQAAGHASDVRTLIEAWPRH